MPDKSMIETISIFRNPARKTRIENALKKIAEGKAKPFSLDLLEDLLQEVGEK